MKKPELRETLLNERAFSPEDIAKVTGRGIGVVRKYVDLLRKEGYSFAEHDGVYVRSTAKSLGGSADLSRRFASRNIRFGVVSDTHMGSSHEKVDELHGMYEIFKKEGVSTVFHAGDLTEGVGVFRGQEFEVHKYGQQQQIDWLVENYPEVAGITTFAITGNHDLRAYERGGVDPGVQIDNQRKDINYLGQMTALVKLSGGVDIELLHPDGGQAYALSYKMQRDVNNRPEGTLPNILVYGHYHTSYYMHYRGVDCIQAPSFKGTGLWEKRQGMNSVIGGWIVDAKFSDDREKITKFEPQLFTF